MMNEALPDLFAQFNVKQGLFRRRERVQAALFELDEYGCVMKTDKLFEPGDTILLDLVMEMPFDNIRADGINGLITERRKHCSNFFYSVDFSELNTGDNAVFSGKLRRIRDVLRKKQSLRSRRTTGPSSSDRQMA
jgi:spore germination protein YaaH